MFSILSFSNYVFAQLKREPNLFLGHAKSVLSMDFDLEELLNQDIDIAVANGNSERVEKNENVADEIDSFLDSLVTDEIRNES